jgi:plastocyanin domain-containing protein
MENQTSIEWIEDKINNYDFNQGMAQMRKYILQAKQMEREQIIDAHNKGIWPEPKVFDDGEEYYNETYGN